MNNILVSISCITYNHSKFIKECLDGFLMQRIDFDYEILIYDDASSDGSQEIIKHYQEKHPDIIKPIFQTENQYSLGKSGFNAKYNYSRAQGKYIALCEGDDYWTDPLKLQKQVDFLEANPDFVVCCHNSSAIDEAGNCIKEKVVKKLNKDTVYSQSDLKKGAWLLTQTLVFRNIDKVFEIQVNNRKKLLNGDMLLISILGKFGKGKYFEDIKPSMYRVHQGGVWSSIKKNKEIVRWNRYELEKVLYQIHETDVEVSTYFKKRLTDLHRKLHRSLPLLSKEQVRQLNKEYFKRNGFS